MINMRTSFGDNETRILRNEDFVVYVSEVGGKRTLVSGVYKYINKEHRVYYFSEGALTSVLADETFLRGGVIVGNNEHTFELRQLILDKIKRCSVGTKLLHSHEIVDYKAIEMSGEAVSHK